jgi:hypothetical protein
MNKLDEYAEAVCSHKNGNNKEASAHLSKAIGLTEPTPIIDSSIDILMKQDTPIHQALTELVELAEKKGKHGRE